MRPTLDELDDFLCGKADEETRQRIGSELLAPESPLRLFVEGARASAEGLLGWPGTLEGDEDTLLRMQNALRERSRVSAWRWLGFVLTHSVAWIAWMFLLPMATYGLFHWSDGVLVLEMAACVCALALDLGVALWRRRPPDGTLWESWQGMVLGTAPFLAVIFMLWMLSLYAGDHSVGWSHAIWVSASVMVFCGFGGALFGLFRGFGLRARVAAGKTTLKEPVLSWVVATFSDSGWWWIVAILVGVPFGMGTLKTFLFFLTACSCMRNALDSAHQRRRNVRVILGAVVGAFVGVGGTAMLYVGGYNRLWAGTATWQVLLGSAWCFGAVCFTVGTWLHAGRLRPFLEEFLRHLLGAMLGLVACVIVAAVVLHRWEGFAESWPFLLDFIMIVCVAVGYYLGYSGKWMVLVPRAPLKWLRETWRQATEDEEGWMGRAEGRRIALLSPRSLVAEAALDYRIMTDTVVSALPEWLRK